MLQNDMSIDPRVSQPFNHLLLSKNLIRARVSGY